MKKIFTTLAIVPLLAPVWELRPPEIDEFKIQGPLKAANDAVVFQYEGMQHVDNDIQLLMIHNLGGTNNEIASRKLLQFIADAENPDLIVAALSQLHRLPFDRQSAVPVIAPLFSHPDRRIRYWSGCLAAELPDLDEELLGTLIEAAREAPAATIRNAALRALHKHAGRLNYTDVIALTETENISARSTAWAVAVSTEGAAEHRQVFINAATGDPSAAVRRAVIMAAAEADYELGHLLRHLGAEDHHPSVRAAAAATARLRKPQQNSEDLFTTDQNLLLDMTQDEDGEVRRTAVESLAAYPYQPALEAVVARFDDDKGFVRRQAEESIVRLADQTEAADVIAVQLQAESAPARMHASNALGRIKAQQYAGDIYANLAGEEKVENIVAVITALSRLQFEPALPSIARYHNHESKFVRAAVAEAFGAIGDSSINEALADLIQDRESNVRWPAIISAGRLEDDFFAPLMLTILEDVRRATGRFSTRDRVAVCWAAPRLKPLPENVMERIEMHVKERVVYTELGFVFDDVEVISSGVMAFAEAGRRNDDYEERTGEFFASYADFLNQAKAESTDYPTTNALINDITRQAEAWFRDDRDIEPVPPPPIRHRLLYQEFAP